MDYSKHYECLIARARGRQLDGYVETHHILPKCMGGSEATTNKVQLTPEEHFVAHQLLCRMYPHVSGLAFALCAMTGNRWGKRSNKAYGWIRRIVAVHQAAESSRRWADPVIREKIRAGIRLVQSTAEYKAKISRIHKGRVKSAQERANIAEAGRKRARRKFDSEALEHIRAANVEKAAERKANGSYLVSAQKTKQTRIRNGSYQFSAQHRANIGQAARGRATQPETRAKLSAALKGRPKSEETKARMRAAWAAKRKPPPPPPTPEQVAQKKAERSARSSAWQKGRTLPNDHKAHIAEGQRRSYDNGRRGARSKLSDDDVRAIRQLLQQPGITQKEIAARYGISQAALSELKSGKSYRHVV